MNPYGIS